MPPIKFKPTEKNYDRRSGTYTTQHYYMKGTSKKDLFDYINSSNAKPKRIHGILKELKRRGIKLIWRNKDA